MKSRLFTALALSIVGLFSGVTALSAHAAPHSYTKSYYTEETPATTTTTTTAATATTTTTTTPAATATTKTPTPGQHHKKSTHYNTRSYKKPTSNHPLVYQYLPPYNAIDVHGPAKVVINYSSRAPAVVLSGGSPQTLPPVPVSVYDRTLTINSRNQPVFVTINTTQPINSITVHDNASVQAARLNSQGLVVNVLDQGSVSIGRAGAIRAIWNNSSQTMTINGINSRSIMVGGNGKGRIVLSGTTRSLEAKLSDSFCLEAQRLKAYEVHIMTRDDALAYVCPTHGLYAFAYNNSDIYYYVIPGQLVRETRMSGNVLRLDNYWATSSWDGDEW